MARDLNLSLFQCILAFFLSKTESIPPLLVYKEMVDAVSSKSSEGLYFSELEIICIKTNALKLKNKRVPLQNALFFSDVNIKVWNVITIITSPGTRVLIGNLRKSQSLDFSYPFCPGIQRRFRTS